MRGFETLFPRPNPIISDRAFWGQWAKPTQLDKSVFPESGDIPITGTHPALLKETTWVTLTQLVELPPATEFLS